MSTFRLTLFFFPAIISAGRSTTLQNVCKQFAALQNTFWAVKRRKTPLAAVELIFSLPIACRLAWCESQTVKKQLMFIAFSDFRTRHFLHQIAKSRSCKHACFRTPSKFLSPRSAAIFCRFLGPQSGPFYRSKSHAKRDFLTWIISGRFPKML